MLIRSTVYLVFKIWSELLLDSPAPFTAVGVGWDFCILKKLEGIFFGANFCKAFACGFVIY